MTVEQTVAELFAVTGHEWTISGTLQPPDEQDVEKALDEAVRILYTESVGSKLSVGGLIIEKRHTGYDVYAYCGSYV